MGELPCAMLFLPHFSSGMPAKIEHCGRTLSINHVVESDRHPKLERVPAARVSSGQISYWKKSELEIIIEEDVDILNNQEVIMGPVAVRGAGNSFHTP